VARYRKVPFYNFKDQIVTLQTALATDTSQPCVNDDVQLCDDVQQCDASQMTDAPASPMPDASQGVNARLWSDASQYARLMPDASLIPA
jgi:hypothetical protein